MTFLLLFSACAQAEKVSSLPEEFLISYQTKERLEKKEKTFISKEYIRSMQPKADETVNQIVDRFDNLMSGDLKPLENPRRNSRLDIHVVHSVSGKSAVSFLILARESYRRKQLRSPFECVTFDMKTGEEIFLTDLFPEDSEAWDLMAEAVYHELSAYFPKQEAEEEALLSLCSREALEKTPFMLGPVCLTLHYEAKTLYPNQPSLMKVSIPYAAFQGMMTEAGAYHTDNSMYKMVGITFDDGPTYSITASLLNTLRHNGAVVTFFLVGDRIAEYQDIVLRENDELHSLQSHHFKHTDTTKSNAGRIQSYSKQFNEALSSVTGTLPVMLRAPYGLSDPFIQAGIELPLIQWDVDTKDWAGRTKSSILSVVKEETKDGSIILMHDVVEDSSGNVLPVLNWLREKGYLCVTMEDLFLHNNQEMKPKRVYYYLEKNPEAAP